MAGGQIAHMDVVADAGAVGCRVIVTIDGDGFAAPKRSIEVDLFAYLTN